MPRLSSSTPSPSRLRRPGTGRRGAPGTGSVRGWLWLAPALLMYGAFVLAPLALSAQYSLYDWDGIGVAKFVGADNFLKVVTDDRLFGSILNAFILIAYFAVFPIVMGLAAAALLKDVRSRSLGAAARTILFLPQIIPLAGAAIAWTWMYSQTGVVNQLLTAVGLGSLANPWLGNFDTALPAVGLIGTWVAFGLCTVLFASGIGKIDPTLYEAARLDGAGRFREFTAITVPGLRGEIVVATTVLVIAALNSFDIVYIATLGGPGFQTMVPGLLIYRLAFTAQKVGLASALGIILTVLIVVVIAPIQRLRRED